MVFSSDYYHDYEYINWTLPVLNMDSAGTPWTVTVQSRKPGRYDVGKHTNVVYAVNSAGQTSSCTFTLEVKREYIKYINGGYRNF